MFPLQKFCVQQNENDQNITFGKTDIMYLVLFSGNRSKLLSKRTPVRGNCTHLPKTIGPPVLFTHEAFQPDSWGARDMKP